MTIKHWPEAERPREKLLARGASSLSDGELLAVLLHTGAAGVTAVDMGRRLLEVFGSINALLSATRAELTEVHGIGDAKYVIFQAARELCRRGMLEPLQREDALTSPAATRRYLLAALRCEAREVFWCLYLDAQHRVLSSEPLFYGTIDSASVYPREVVKACLKHNAAAVIFAHNHPSGVAEPSQADQRITRRLDEALKLVDIRMLDHIVVAGSSAVSMAELGLI